MEAHDLRQRCFYALEQTGIRYAIGGSWASTAFGEPRFTNDIDILADFNLENLSRFLSRLPAEFFADPDEAGQAIRLGRSFNVIYMPMAFKFDFFHACEGRQVSEVQWRDIQGIVRSVGVALDGSYLRQSADTLGILSLLEKALGDT